MHRFKNAVPVESYADKHLPARKKTTKKCLVLDLDETLIHCVDRD